jgi:hypothetical protein
LFAAGFAYEAILSVGMNGFFEQNYIPEEEGSIIQLS